MSGPGPAVLRADWPAPPGVHALQTLRGQGASIGPWAGLNLGDHCGDEPACVAANRLALREGLHLPGEPGWLRQVHGTAVARLPATVPLPEADAAWTDRAGVVCAILTADCLPVVLAADDGSVVAAAHAGWRGLAGGVLEATVAALPVAPQRLRAWMGAAIGPAAFEVGPEVRAAFVGRDPATAVAFRPGAGDRWLADLYALARRRLMQMGVSRVDGGGECTYGAADRWYSFRRDRLCGRMATLIWRS
ncbi:MAG TPA: peptidoglycan editing factor PgeF [Solimonas sp.]|nr:peptidoglycan editing factor PgeF [Solimonas sp.]